MLLVLKASSCLGLSLWLSGAKLLLIRDWASASVKSHRKCHTDSSLSLRDVFFAFWTEQGTDQEMWTHIQAWWHTPLILALGRQRQAKSTKRVPGQPGIHKEALSREREKGWVEENMDTWLFFSLGHLILGEEIWGHLYYSEA